MEETQFFAPLEPGRERIIVRVHPSVELSDGVRLRMQIAVANKAMEQMQSLYHARVDSYVTLEKGVGLATDVPKTHVKAVRKILRDIVMSSFQSVQPKQ